MDTTETRIVLRPDGSLAKETTTIEYLKGQFVKTIVDKELKSVSVFTPVLANTNLGHIRMLINGTGKITHGIIRLTALNFHAPWVVASSKNDDGTTAVVLRPDMRSDAPAMDPLSSNKDLLWQIPKILPTFLVVDVTGFGLALGSFFQREPGKFELCRLPVPNQWEDTRLCFELTTEEKQTAVKLQFLERIEFIYSRWLASKWNNDLYRPTEFTRTFTWDADGKQIIPQEADALKKFLSDRVLLVNRDLTPELESVYGKVISSPEILS